MKLILGQPPSMPAEKLRLQPRRLAATGRVRFCFFDRYILPPSHHGSQTVNSTAHAGLKTPINTLSTSSRPSKLEIDLLMPLP